VPLLLSTFPYSNSYSKIKGEIIMCDAEIIAAILEELGYFDEKKVEDKKDEVHDEGNKKDNSENSGDEERK